MRRITIVLAALLLASLAVGAARGAHGSFATGKATQHPVNQSGAMGRVSFTQVGATVLATGTATGLAPSVGRYITLIYDLRSVPGGPTVCEPVEEFPNMFVGIWSVDASGAGTLIQLDPFLPPLGTWDTTSIRDTTINGGFGPEAVVACGEVSVHPAGG